MKRRSTQLITGILLAGMLAISGCGDAGATESVVTVVRPMEVNEATPIPESTSVSEVTKYTNINDFISSRPKGTAYAKLALNGKDVVIIADSTYRYGDKNVAFKGKVYSVVGGKVCCVAHLNNNGTAYTFGYGNGVLYSCTIRTYETYTVTSDGMLVHKDYVVESFDTDPHGTYTIVNSNGTTSPLVGGYEAYQKLYDNSNNAPSVNFTIK